ncbi:MAG: SDR family NAD(P)-dependent oxidoreductase [Pseudomonadota bacterium]
MQLAEGMAAIVTGGASGLGGATARMLAEAGVKVAIFDLSEEKGAAMAEAIGGSFHMVDVAESESVAAGIADARAAHGQERICVNCAGIGVAARTVDREGKPHDPAFYRKIVGINLFGTFNTASQAAAGMSAADPVNADGERGVIVNTASVAAFDGQIGQIAYAASKGAVAAMTLPMARDLSRAGIRVMTIAPGLFLTPMLEGLPAETQASLGAQVPFPPRLGAPSEFAAMVRAIIENPMLNGDIVRLDGAIRMAPK